MARYKFWDKKEDIYTLGKDRDTGKMQWSAEDYISHKAPWAANPAVKVIVSDGPINGMVFQEFTVSRDQYIRMGMEIPEGATDEDILALMEAWEDRKPDTAPSPQERIAAALEYQNLINS